MMAAGGAARQEIAGDVAVVDRLDQQVDAVRGQRGGREAQVVDEGRLRALGRDIRRQLARQAVQALDVQVERVFQRQFDRVLEFADAARIARQSALACGPVSGREIMQRQF